MPKPTKPTAKPGRPTLFTTQLGEAICDAIATNAKSLDWICENSKGFPSSRTVSRWQASDETFCQEVTRACARRADILIDECLDIADETGRDTKLVGRRDAPAGEGTEVCNFEWISRSKLRIETRLKLAAMLNRKKYGDKLEVDQTIYHADVDDTPAQTVAEWQESVAQENATIKLTVCN